MDRDFGLVHVKLQTWFPLPIQVYVNGHEWLARKLEENEIRYSKLEGFRESSEVFRPLLSAGLASTSQPLCQEDQSADGRSSEEHALLLGNRPKRVLHRYSL